MRGPYSESFPTRLGKTYVHFMDKYYKMLCYRPKTVLLLLHNITMINIRAGTFGKFREISGNFKISENSGKCRDIFSGKIPGNFPRDFPAFSGDETHVTALILSFKKLKIEEISGNFGRKFPGNSGKFSPKNVGKFSPNFSVFFGWKRMLQP